MGVILAAIVAAEVQITAAPLVSGTPSYVIGAFVIVGLAVFMINRSMSAINDPRPASTGAGEGGDDTEA